MMSASASAVAAATAKRKVLIFIAWVPTNENVRKEETPVALDVVDCRVRVWRPRALEERGQDKTERQHGVMNPRSYGCRCFNDKTATGCRGSSIANSRTMLGRRMLFSGFGVLFACNGRF